MPKSRTITVEIPLNALLSKLERATGLKRKTKASGKPSPAQKKARAKFARMAKMRAKKARAAKRAKR